MGEWTSVKDKLPESNGKYLVATSLFGMIPCVKIDCFSNKLRDVLDFMYEDDSKYDIAGWYNSNSEGSWIESNVLYWMPLPEPPCQNRRVST